MSPRVVTSSVPFVSLRQRIWILLLVAVLLVLTAALAVRSGYNTVARTNNQVTNQLQPASEAVADLNTALAEMENAVTSYALTGDVADLGTFIEGTARAATDFRNLRGLLASDPELSRLIRDARQAQLTWKRQGTQPIIEATEKGTSDEARVLVRSGASRNLYNDVRTYTNTLDQRIRDLVDYSVAQQEAESLRLSLLLNVSILIVLGLLAVASALLLRGVLGPLRDLQQQMLTVAQEGNHEMPISASGPPELRAVGQDAEKMRRELVTGFDRVRQADEGLEQQTPVLAAIRAELADSHTTTVPGVDLFGVQRPAEGVMAGDWWSAQVLLDGALAVTITDVSGHGPAAGMEALRLKHVLELSLAQNGDPALALKQAAEGFRVASRFATCVIVVVDPQTGFLTWANAGHPPARMVTATATTELVSTGPLLSVLGGAWTNEHTHLDLGSTLLLWTDGLTESREVNNLELGDEGVTKIVAKALETEETSEGIVGYILASARARSVDWQRDDVTCVAVRRV